MSKTLALFVRNPCRHPSATILLGKLSPWKTKFIRTLPMLYCFRNCCVLRPTLLAQISMILWCITTPSTKVLKFSNLVYRTYKICCTLVPTFIDQFISLTVGNIFLQMYYCLQYYYYYFMSVNILDEIKVLRLWHT